MNSAAAHYFAFLRSGSTLAVAVLLTACGSSSNSNSAGDAAAASTTTSTGGSSCVAPANECTLLSASEVNAALATTSTGMTAGTMGPGDTSISQPASGECQWTGPSANASISVGYSCGLVAVTETAETNAFKAQVGAGTAVAVAGLGDSAIWAVAGSFTSTSADGGDAGAMSTGSLSVLSGDLVLTVVINGSGEPSDVEARAVAAAKAALGRLF